MKEFFGCLGVIITTGLVIVGLVHWTAETVGVLAAGAALVAVRWVMVRRLERARGWRVGHRGQHTMYYDEIVEGTWQRMEIDGEMLGRGPAHHVIYFRRPDEWNAYPEWALDRRDEIIARIKSEFAPPGYEYAGDT